jgi:transposase
MNTKSVEGKKIEKAALGYNRKRPGRLSLNWTVGHIAKVALFSQLHSGTTNGTTVLKDQVGKIEKLMIRLGLSPRDDRYVWRVDGGYFSWNNLAFLNKRRFITRLKINAKVLKPWLEDKKTLNKLAWKRYTKASCYTDLGEIYFPDVGIRGTDFRVVLVKTYRKRKRGKEREILLYPLCTNLLDWKARTIVKAYRGRQIVENCFRDTNQAFYSDKLPSSTFHGNQAFLWFICLAYNLFFFFRNSPRSKKNSPPNS